MLRVRPPFHVSSQRDRVVYFLYTYIKCLYLCLLWFHSIHARPMQGFRQVHWICERMNARVSAFVLAYIYFSYVYMCVCVHVCVRARVRVCVCERECVCVRERRSIKRCGHTQFDVSLAIDSRVLGVGVCVCERDMTHSGCVLFLTVSVSMYMDVCD